MNRSIGKTTLRADKPLFIFGATRCEAVQTVGSSYRSLNAHCIGAAGRGHRHRAG